MSIFADHLGVQIFRLLSSDLHSIEELNELRFAHRPEDKFMLAGSISASSQAVYFYRSLLRVH